MVLRAANLGDDDDTTAAIAGQLIGALVGETGKTAEWLERLASRERFTQLAHRLLALMDGKRESTGRTSKGHHF